MLGWSLHILTAAPEERDGTDLTQFLCSFLTVARPRQETLTNMIKLQKLGNKMVANPAKSTAISPGLKFLLPKIVRDRGTLQTMFGIIMTFLYCYFCYF